MERVCLTVGKAGEGCPLIRFASATGLRISSAPQRAISSVGERCFHTAEVECSIHSSPTIFPLSTDSHALVDQRDEQPIVRLFVAVGVVVVDRIVIAAADGQGLGQPVAQGAICRVVHPVFPANASQCRITRVIQIEGSAVSPTEIPVEAEAKIVRDHRCSVRPWRLGLAVFDRRPHQLRRIGGA